MSSVKRAFLVGINYRGTKSELYGCINDANSIKQLLISQYGYKEENILFLSDDTAVKPTGENIIEGWKWLLSNSPASEYRKTPYKSFTESDSPQLVFHYSGHGTQIIDTNNDESDKRDEVICPIDNETKGMISDDVIREVLVEKVPANGKLIGIIDSCNSGSVFDLLWNVKATSRKGSYSLEQVEQYTPTAGVVIMLSGCKDTQLSTDMKLDGKYQGVMSYALVQTLKRANYDITCDKLLTNIRNYIKQRRLSDQIPCLSFGKTIDIATKFTL